MLIKQLNKQAYLCNLSKKISFHFMTEHVEKKFSLLPVF